MIGRCLHRPLRRHRPTLIGTVGVLAVLSIASSAGPARAYLCTRTPGFGPSVAWPVREVVVQRSGRGVEVDEAAIDEALGIAVGAWTGVPCSDLVVTPGPPTTERLVGFDWHAGSGSPENENVVVFRNDRLDDPLDAWLHTLGAIAITTVTFDTSTGTLVDADIEMNDTAFEFTACDPEDPRCFVIFDVANTLTHEVGHVVGLDHPPPESPGATEATMFASAPSGDTAKRTLASDDEDGLCAIYPADTPVAGECYGVPRTPSTVRFEQTGCSSGPATVPALSALALVVWRRRRRRR
jgi:hypothetical protein